MESIDFNAPTEMAEISNKINFQVTSEDQLLFKKEYSTSEKQEKIEEEFKKIQISNLKLLHKHHKTDSSRDSYGYSKEMELLMEQLKFERLNKSNKGDIIRDQEERIAILEKEKLILFSKIELMNEQKTIREDVENEVILGINL